MGTVTMIFLVVGAIGIVVLAVSLFLGELLHIGHADVDGPFSVPALAGFVGALGFVGAIGASLAGGQGAPAILIGGAVGLAAAIPVAWFAARLSRGLMTMSTDRTLSSGDLLGSTGIVVTRIPAGGYGEVRLTVAGQHMKLNARADDSLPVGASVFVVEVPSETSVVVIQTAPTA